MNNTQIRGIASRCWTLPEVDPGTKAPGSDRCGVSRHRFSGTMRTAPPSLPWTSPATRELARLNNLPSNHAGRDVFCFAPRPPSEGQCLRLVGYVSFGSQVASVVSACCRSRPPPACLSSDGDWSESPTEAGKQLRAGSALLFKQPSFPQPQANAFL
jgi:hypothetical protein